LKCRVRRSEIQAGDSSDSERSSSPDPELERQLQQRLASLYGPVQSTTFSQPAQIKETLLKRAKETRTEPVEEPSFEHPHEFEFRLFSTSSNTKSTKHDTQRVILDVEDSGTRPAGFVTPKRNPSYYFTVQAQGEEKWRFEYAAMSGEEVLDARKRRAWGLEVPWRVTVIKVPGKIKRNKAPKATDIENVDSKKGKPGKKQRIILRKRAKLILEAEEKRKRELELKSETEKEKRVRKNREKKLKRRIKEKAEKAKKAGGVAAVQEGGGEFASADVAPESVNDEDGD
jgi:hypothetical protein